MFESRATDTPTHLGLDTRPSKHPRSNHIYIYCLCRCGVTGSKFPTPAQFSKMAHESADSKEHLEPWFDDGNIVLVAGGQCFKVYRGTLSVHSPIFKDMFSCPQPADQGEVIDGCAVVHLQDSASEVQHVLKALFHGQYISSSQSMPVSVATALLRLGKKYEFKLLFDCVSSRVKGCYPRELPSNSGPARVEGTLTGRDPLDFQLLNIIREVGLLTVLPIALHACAFSADIEKLLDGYDWNGVRYSLSPINQRACIIARDRRSELGKRVFTNIFLRPEDRYFLESTTCLLCRSRCCATSLSADPFAVWDPDWNSRFCKNCVADLKLRYHRYRKDAFIYLPWMFDVGSSWDQVQKDETNF